MEFEKTYLYKLHVLTNMLDKAFDRTLRNHTEIGLSQFSILFTVSQFGAINQRKLADFLEVSTPAVSRQVDIAQRMGWLTVTPSSTDRHGNSVALTPQGKALVKTAHATLEHHLFKIFSDHNHHTNLMEHIDLLLGHTKEVLSEQNTLKRSNQANNVTLERISL